MSRKRRVILLGSAFLGTLVATGVLELHHEDNRWLRLLVALLRGVFLGWLVAEWVIWRQIRRFRGGHTSGD